MSQIKQRINSSDIDIFLTERNVKVSDEKLKNMLSEAYEKAQCNSTAFHFANMWSVFLSISGTLLLSIITSTFNPIGRLSADWVKGIIVILCLVFGILSIVLLICRGNKIVKSHISERDKAVEEIMSNHQIKGIVIDE